jgi:hypothetical protein
VGVKIILDDVANQSADKSDVAAGPDRHMKVCGCGGSRKARINNDHSRIA